MLNLKPNNFQKSKYEGSSALSILSFTNLKLNAQKYVSHLQIPVLLRSQVNCIVTCDKNRCKYLFHQVGPIHLNASHRVYSVEKHVNRGLTTTSSLVRGYTHFGGTHSLHLQEPVR